MSVFIRSQRACVSSIRRRRLYHATPLIHFDIRGGNLVVQYSSGSPGARNEPLIRSRPAPCNLLSNMRPGSFSSTSSTMRPLAMAYQARWMPPPRGNDWSAKQPSGSVNRLAIPRPAWW